MTKKKFDGTISEIMVAYKPNADIDFEPIKKMIEYQVQHKVDGLFMGGLSTQTYLLSITEKIQICEVLCNVAAGRVPIMMNIMENSLEDTKKLVAAYIDIGVDAISISQPSVFPYTEEALVEYFEEVIPEDYPTYLYNTPQTGNTLSPKLAARIVNAHPNLLGYKDSTQSMVGIQEMMGLVNNKDFQYISGSDGMTLPIMSVGGVGVISATSVPFPDVILAITESFFAGDMEKAKEAQRFSMKLRTLLKTATDMNGYTYACELIGIPFRGTRMPNSMMKITDAQKQHIHAGLVEMGLV